MAGNTRGKLKEHFEGIHRNFDWQQYHIKLCLELIKDHKPELSKLIFALGKSIEALDNLAQDVYSKL